MMAWIRKNPFSTDPKIEMIKFVSDYANLSGAPLTDADRAILASENPTVDDATEQRLRVLIGEVIADQKASGKDADRRSFVNAIEWAGDLEYPYIVALAESVLTESRVVDQVVRRSYGGAWLIGCLTVVLLVIVLVLLLRTLS